jgi:putative membrane protein
MIIILIPAINKIEGELMELTIIGLNFLYAALGVVLMFISYKIFDKLSPKIDFEDELKKGNIAVAIFIAALFISIALIIGGALN